MSSIFEILYGLFRYVVPAWLRQLTGRPQSQAAFGKTSARLLTEKPAEAEEESADEIDEILENLPWNRVYVESVLERVSAKSHESSYRLLMHAFRLTVWVQRADQAVARRHSTEKDLGDKERLRAARQGLQNYMMMLVLLMNNFEQYYNLSSGDPWRLEETLTSHLAEADKQWKISRQYARSLKRELHIPPRPVLVTA